VVAVVVASVRHGVSQREVMDGTFRHLPGEESQAEWVSGAAETMSLMAGDPELADDLLDLANR
jgi:hypothetical protein